MHIWMLISGQCKNKLTTFSRNCQKKAILKMSGHCDKAPTLHNRYHYESATWFGAVQCKFTSAQIFQKILHNFFLVIRFLCTRGQLRFCIYICLCLILETIRQSVNAPEINGNKLFSYRLFIIADVYWLLCMALGSMNLTKEIQFALRKAKAGRGMDLPSYWFEPRLYCESVLRLSGCCVDCKLFKLYWSMLKRSFFIGPRPFWDLFDKDWCKSTICLHFACLSSEFELNVEFLDLKEFQS